MSHHDHQHTLDVACHWLAWGGTTGACLTIFDIFTNIVLPILSGVSLLLSIAWFIYRFYKALKE